MTNDESMVECSNDQMAKVIRKFGHSFIIRHLSFVISLACVALVPAGCERDQVTGISPRIASVTPAGTDLLIAVGGADHLVAVSNYDDDREGVTGKPRIGDYSNLDWEKLASVHARYLLLQESPDRVSDAMKERCGELGITIVNLQIESIADIWKTMATLSGLINQTGQTSPAEARIQTELANVQARVNGRPKVRALIVTSDDGLSVAGPGTFLDELLTTAGGENVAAKLGRRYAMVEPEMLLSMAPDVVIQLIPDGQKTPQVMEQAKRFWAQMGNLPAVKNNRVYILTDWYSLEPGSHVGELAGKFADCLHPETKQ
jgi:iron complex transport system substrate-binding protein